MTFTVTSRLAIHRTTAFILDLILQTQFFLPLTPVVEFGPAAVTSLNIKHVVTCVLNLVGPVVSESWIMGQAVPISDSNGHTLAAVVISVRASELRYVS